MFLTGLARTMVNEAAMGVTRGHEEARLFMERYIGRFETLASPPPERAGPVPDSA